MFFLDHFASSGSMIQLMVPEIHCTRKNGRTEEEDRGIGYSSKWMYQRGLGQVVGLVGVLRQLQRGQIPRRENETKKSSQRSFPGSRRTNSALQQTLSARWHETSSWPICFICFPSDCTNLKVSLHQVSKDAEYKMNTNLSRPSNHSLLSSIILVSVCDKQNPLHKSQIFHQS